MKILLTIALATTLVMAACGDDSKSTATPVGSAASGSQASPSTGGVRPSSSPTQGGQPAPPTQQTDGNAPGIPPLTGPIQTTASGLRYIDEKVGDGASPTKGQQTTVQYTGWLTNGTKFDSSRDRNSPFTFPIGMEKVIKGWDEGVATMKVGGKRRLIIPAALAYGPTGRPPTIPGNSTLIFDVELIAVQ
jgi:peptidylprolyl isomerase